MSFGFPHSTQIMTSTAPITGSPYGNAIMGLMINPQDPASAQYNYAEANGVAMMQMTGDDGNGYYNRTYHNLYGNYGPMQTGGQNLYTQYQAEPYRFGFYPVGYPYGMNTSRGPGIPVMYSQGFPRYA